ncbi:MAG: RelA/SpoT family protein [Bacteroidia bacterium]|nr:RelA/SpoT family protein [Bacteroidia bacterium]
MALLDGEVYEAYRTELLNRYRQLLRTLGNRITKEKTAKIREAFDFAARAHEGTFRKSGEPYIFHPLAVAQIAVGELGLGSTSVISALLHDVVEDTDVTLDEIERRFGPKVADIINGLTKISVVFEAVDNSSIQAENFKKMLLTLGEDLRVILIKLCDRLHNMRTLGSVSENTKLKIASETMYIYAPLAHRLGLNAIKTEMEDLALKFTDPSVYREISSKIAESKLSRQRYIREFIEPIKETLNASGLNIHEIKGRPKSIYSIHKKMLKQGIPFEEVYDAFAIRIIVDSPINQEKTDCWRVYSIISDSYQTHESRLRDWLSRPKNNGYSALHTTVLGPKGRWVEVQIRSKRMDEIAERGLAAHWRYKAIHNEDVPPTPQDQAFDHWLDAVKETLDNNDLSALDLVNEFKNTLLGEDIYVFTPKGAVKSFPMGSIALDFGFSIHTEVGLKTLGAKVNNKLVPISHELKNGDIVEILTTTKYRATQHWLGIVKTGRSKSKIREFLRDEKTKQSGRGRQIMERMFQKHAINFTDKNIKLLNKHYGYTHSSEFFHAVADGQIRMNKELLLEILQKDKNKDSVVPTTKDGVNKSPENIRKKAAQIVFGEDYDLPYSLARCCNPLPGEPIFGFITVGEGVKIHRTTCPNASKLMSQYGYRIIPATWRSVYETAFDAHISVRGIDDVGIVSKIADIISKDMEVNMKSINIKAHDDGTFGGQIEVLVRNSEDLQLLCDRIKSTHKHIEVSRIEGK